MQMHRSIALMFLALFLAGTVVMGYGVYLLWAVGLVLTRMLCVPAAIATLALLYLTVDAVKEVRESS